MIESFYNSTATNTRRSTASPTGGDTTTTISSFSGLLRPITDVTKLFVANNIGKEFDYVCDDSVDINVGDDLYTNDSYFSGIKFSVIGVSKFKDLEDNTDSYTNIRIVK